MKIVVLDGYTENPGDLSWGGLEELGELTVYDRTTDVSMIAGRIGDAEAVYTNKTPISADTIAACQSLKFIGVLATGYNVVDVEAARAAGIVVCNIPTYGTAAVAQYAIALMLELCHHIGEHSECVGGNGSIIRIGAFGNIPLLNWRERRWESLVLGESGREPHRSHRHLV